MNLPELLSTHRDVVMQHWLTLVRGTLHNEALPRVELLDHLPSFIDEVALALRASEGPENSPTAVAHGVQRLTLGFNLDGVVREYGALRDAIYAIAARENVPVSVRERDILFECVVTAIADAVSEYQRQRDAELHRQMNEHFAFIAHELRNPLSSSLIALQLLQNTGAIHAGKLEQSLQGNLLRLRDLIDTSLRATQIASGITLRREWVSVATLLADVELAASSAATLRQVGLTATASALGEIHVDLRLVHSALSNLVQNAVKFTNPGSEVQVRTSAKGEVVIFEVEDCCGGLPAGFAEKAFLPFAQLSADRSGFGLGLAIAKQAADAHGGSLRVQNLPQKGCVFVLELPAEHR